MQISLHIVLINTNIVRVIDSKVGLASTWVDFVNTAEAHPWAHSRLFHVEQCELRDAGLSGVFHVEQFHSFHNILCLNVHGVAATLR